MKIALSNAHTEYAPGASGTVDGVILHEYKLSCQINKEVKKILDFFSVESYIVDTSDITPYKNSLYYKISRINTNTFTDIVVETHFNSANLLTANHSSGLEVLYSPKLSDSKELALCLVSSLKNHLPFKIRRGNGLYERDNLYLLNNSPCPGVIIEVCFLSHPKDRIYLIQPRALEVIASGIADGILQYGRKKGLLLDGGK